MDVARQYVQAGLTQRAQIAHGEHVVLFMNDFDEPEIRQTGPSRPSKILPQASPVAACC